MYNSPLGVECSLYTERVSRTLYWTGGVELEGQKMEDRGVVSCINLSQLDVR